jgi:hypothetical protein
VKTGWQVLEVGGSVACTKEELDFALGELASVDAPALPYTIKFVNSGRKCKVGKGKGPWQRSRKALGGSKWIKEV